MTFADLNLSCSMEIKYGANVWPSSWIDDLENRIDDSKAVEAFLVDISEDYN